jgi:hypothetical protein
MFLDAAYPGIVAEVVAAMRSVQPANRVGQMFAPSPYAEAAGHVNSCVQVSSYSKAWPCLIPQHGPGRKHQRPIVLADWQRSLIERDPRPLLRGLVHSDGCRFVNTGRGGWRNARYAFSNRSADLHGIFREACDLLGLHWTAAGQRTTYVSRKADVARMDEFIGPKA